MMPCVFMKEGKSFHRILCYGVSPVEEDFLPFNEFSHTDLDTVSLKRFTSRSEIVEMENDFDSVRLEGHNNTRKYKLDYDMKLDVMLSITNGRKQKTEGRHEDGYVDGNYVGSQNNINLILSLINNVHACDSSSKADSIRFVISKYKKGVSKMKCLYINELDLTNITVVVNYMINKKYFQ